MLQLWGTPSVRRMKQLSCSETRSEPPFVVIDTRRSEVALLCCVYVCVSCCVCKWDAVERLCSCVAVHPKFMMCEVAMLLH